MELFAVGLLGFCIGIFSMHIVWSIFWIKYH